MGSTVPERRTRVEPRRRYSRHSTQQHEPRGSLATQTRTRNSGGVVHASMYSKVVLPHLDLLRSSNWGCSPPGPPVDPPPPQIVHPYGAKRKFGVELPPPPSPQGSAAHGGASKLHTIIMHFHASIHQSIVLGMVHVIRHHIRESRSTEIWRRASPTHLGGGWARGSNSNSNPARKRM
jgi:hypothetical protein